MDATLEVLKAAKADIKYEEIVVGEQQYLAGAQGGIDDAGWESIDRTHVLLKAPITTPLGKGVKSLNVSLRKKLSLFANIRPVTSFQPYVPSHHAMNLVIVRENEEDLYAGIEHRQTPDVIQCLKLLTIPGSERIVRYAFEYAAANNRKKITCVTKSNIMKLTDGMFQRIFEEVAEEHPEFETDHQIVDIATAKIAAHPEDYDVVVLPNLYGDIVSDVAAEVAGSVGLCGSSNIGQNYAMFEAIHGSAPDIAGKDMANPSGLIMGSVLMMSYLGQPEVANVVQNALLKTIEDGMHTADIQSEEYTKELVGTQRFAQEIIKRLGQKPQTLPQATYAGQDAASVKRKIKRSTRVRPKPKKDLVGTDVFVQFEGSVEDLAAKVQEAAKGTKAELKMISNRGVMVWPDGHDSTFKVDHWRLRLEGGNTSSDVIELLQRVDSVGLEVIKTENLYNFDGKPGYSKGQGQ